jgi:ankyrin repeat protein
LPALHLAAAKGHTEIAEGADVNADVKDGRTPLDIVLPQKQTRTVPTRRVIRNDHTEIADLLRKHSGKTGIDKHR